MSAFSQNELETIVKNLTDSPRLKFDAELNQILPIGGGIYRICNTSTNPPTEIYIGKSSNLRSRIYTNHFTGGVGNSTLTRKLINYGHFQTVEEVHSFLRQSCKVQFIEIGNERLRCFAEHYAIAILQPLHDD